MTDEKLLEVFDLYERKLGDPHDRCNEIYNPHLQHAKGMIKEMRRFVADARREKAMRWLGFVQGVLWTQRVYTIEEMKSHNSPSHDQHVTGLNGVPGPIRQGK